MTFEGLLTRLTDDELDVVSEVLETIQDEIKDAQDRREKAKANDVDGLAAALAAKLSEQDRRYALTSIKSGNKAAALRHLRYVSGWSLEEAEAAADYIVATE